MLSVYVLTEALIRVCVCFAHTENQKVTDDSCGGNQRGKENTKIQCRRGSRDWTGNLRGIPEEDEEGSRFWIVHSYWNLTSYGGG